MDVIFCRALGGRVGGDVLLQARSVKPHAALAAGGKYGHQVLLAAVGFQHTGLEHARVQHVVQGAGTVGVANGVAAYELPRCFADVCAPVALLATGHVGQNPAHYVVLLVGGQA